MSLLVMEVKVIFISKFIDFEINIFLEMCQTMRACQLKQELVSVVNWGLLEFGILKNYFTNDTLSKNEVK